MPDGPGPAPGERRAAAKSEGAFRTIGEVSSEIGLPQHILRYWESHFPQLRPLQRAGNRRYYRPADVALVRRIDGLLNRDGYTIRGVQQLLAKERVAPAPAAAAAPAVAPAVAGGASVVDALRLIRDALAQALRDDAAS